MAKLWTPKKPYSVGNVRPLTLGAIAKRKPCMDGYLIAKRIFGETRVLMIGIDWANALPEEHVSLLQVRLGWMINQLLPRGWADCYYGAFANLPKSYSAHGLARGRGRLRIWAQLYVEAGKP